MRPQARTPLLQVSAIKFTGQQLQYCLFMEFIRFLNVDVVWMLLLFGCCCFLVVVVWLLLLFCCCFVVAVVVLLLFVCLFICLLVFCCCLLFCSCLLLFFFVMFLFVVVMLLFCFVVVFWLLFAPENHNPLHPTQQKMFQCVLPFSFLSISVFLVFSSSFFLFPFLSFFSSFIPSLFFLHLFPSERSRTRKKKRKEKT